MQAVNNVCVKIDDLKSKIDLEYNKLNELKQAIIFEFGLDPSDRITASMKERSHLVGEFFTMVGKISDLKKARRALYCRIAGIKKVFVWISSQC